MNPRTHVPVLKARLKTCSNTKLTSAAACQCVEILSPKCPSRRPYDIRKHDSVYLSSATVDSRQYFAGYTAAHHGKCILDEVVPA